METQREKNTKNDEMEEELWQFMRLRARKI